MKEISMSEIRQDLQNRILIRLAGNIVDVELGAPELEEAVRTTLGKFRQLSSNSVEEAHIFLEMQENKTVYILPDQVIEVREIFRRGLGRTQGGVTFDPFNAAFTNFYLLEAGRQGGLATFRLFTEYQELIGTFLKLTRKDSSVRQLVALEFSHSLSITSWLMRLKSKQSVFKACLVTI